MIINFHTQFTLITSRHQKTIVIIFIKTHSTICSSLSSDSIVASKPPALWSNSHPLNLFEMKRVNIFGKSVTETQRNFTIIDNKTKLHAHGYRHNYTHGIILYIIYTIPSTHITHYHIHSKKP